MNKNYEIAEKILNQIGGKENVVDVFHCATRLRFHLKDESLVNDEEIKKIDGIYGTMHSAGMYQIIVGQNVEKVYDQLCGIGGFKKEKGIEETLDEEVVSSKLTLKKIGNNIVSYVVSSMTPIINILMGAALWNVLGTILGPTLLNVVPSDGGFAITCTIIFNALMYFVPIYIGYGAAKALKISNPVWGMVIGGLTIVPTFINQAAVSSTFELFGFITVPVADYGQSVIPVLLGVFVFKYLYEALKKIIPDLVFSIFAPFIIFFVMTIVMLYAFCPLGTVIGNVISDVFLAMSEAIWPIRFLAYVLLSASWCLITLCGMHLPIAYAVFAIIAQNGCDPFAIACMNAGIYVLNGMSIGAIFKSKTKEQRSNSVSACISAVIGGICEPALYGVCLKNKSTLRVMVVGGALAGAVASILRPVCYTITAGASIFNLLGPWSGADGANVVKGVAMVLIALVIGLVGILLFANMDDEKKVG